MFRPFPRFLISGWFRLPAVSPLEGFFSRFLVAAVVFYSFRRDIPYEDADHPVGLLALLEPLGFSLNWLADPSHWQTYNYVLILVAALYISGFALPLVLPLMALMHILPFTFFNSQGYTHHGHQIVSLTLLAQATVAVYAAIKDRRLLLLPHARMRSWLMLQAQVVITGCYLVSVVTKMERSEGRWFANSNYIAVDMVKTHRQGYLNHFEPERLAEEQKARWFLERPHLSRLIFNSGVLLEAVCVFTIGNRLLGLFLGVALIAMHRSISELMGLNFINNELLVAIFLVGVPFGLAWCFEKISSRSLRHALLAGLGVGIPLSYFWQTAMVRSSFNVVTYSVEVLESIGAWRNWGFGFWFSFLQPVLVTCFLSALAGLGVGVLLGRRHAPPASGAPPCP